MELRTFLIVFVISLTIVISILVNTYIFTFINKNPFINSYLAIQVLLLVWMILHIGELFAPASEKLDLCRFGGVVIAAITVPFFVYLLIFTRGSKKVIKMFESRTRLITFATFSISIICFIIAENFIASVFYYLTPVIISLVLIIVMRLLIWVNHISKSSDLSLKNVISNIGDCIIVLDAKGRIMDVRLSFFEKLFTVKPDTYKEFTDIITKYLPNSYSNSDMLENLQNNNELEFELPLTIAFEDFYYRVRTTPLNNDKRLCIGKMLTFHDITDNKKLVIELDSKNIDLTEINEKLKDYLLVVSQLEEAKQKKEIMFNIQNSIGQEIMELLSILEVARIRAIEKNDFSIKELELAIASCRKVMGEIRGSVSILIENMEEYKS